MKVDQTFIDFALAESGRSRDAAITARAPSGQDGFTPGLVGRAG